MSLKDRLQILLVCLLLLPKKGRCEAPHVVEKILNYGWIGGAAVTDTAPGHWVLLLLFHSFMFASSDVCLGLKEDRDNWSDVTYHLKCAVAVLSVCCGPNHSLGSLTCNFHWFWWRLNRGKQGQGLVFWLSCAWRLQRQIKSCVIPFILSKLLCEKKD